MRAWRPSGGRSGPVILGCLGLAYLLPAVVTGLSWPSFRDEPTYLEAARSFAEALPAPVFTLDICGVGIALWGAMIRLAGATTAALRASVLVFAIANLAVLLWVARRLGERRPILLVALLGTLPELYAYSFQVNGSAIAYFLSCAGLLAWVRLRAPAAPSLSAFLGTSAILALSAVQNPFSLGYTVSAVAVGVWSRGRRDAREPAMPVRGIVALAAAAVVWWAFVALSRPTLGESLARHATSLAVNRSLLGRVYPGNLFVVLAFLGGMFPLAVGAFPRRLPARAWLPVALAAVALGLCFLPRTGGAYHDHFHTIFTMAGARVAAALGGPRWLNHLLFAGLVALGAYILQHLIWLTWRRPHARFFLLGSVLSLAALSLDGYASARLALPGSAGLLYLLQSCVAANPAAARRQLAYQVLWCAAYAIALGAKHGFLGR